MSNPTLTPQAPPQAPPQYCVTSPFLLRAYAARGTAAVTGTMSARLTQEHFASPPTETAPGFLPLVRMGASVYPMGSGAPAPTSIPPGARPQRRYATFCASHWQPRYIPPPLLLTPPQPPAQRQPRHPHSTRRSSCHPAPAAARSRACCRAHNT